MQSPPDIRKKIKSGQSSLSEVWRQIELDRLRDSGEPDFQITIGTKELSKKARDLLLNYRSSEIKKKMIAAINQAITSQYREPKNS